MNLEACLRHLAEQFTRSLGLREEISQGGRLALSLDVDQGPVGAHQITRLECRGALQVDQSAVQADEPGWFVRRHILVPLSFWAATPAREGEGREREPRQLLIDEPK